MRSRSFLLVTLTLIHPAASVPAQTHEPVLGKPSAILPPTREQETVSLEAGVRIREQPRLDSPVLEILGLSLELPVLDRQGSWVKVRFGTWQGWVLSGSDDSREGAEPYVSFGPDEERLTRARSLLGVDVEPRPLGPFSLYTDVADQQLLAWLSVVAQDVSRAYRERFDLDPGSRTQESLVVFADETDYRRFEAAEDRIAKADSRGYTSEGLSVLFVGDHTRTSLVSVFIHELTHLLNRRVFRAETPPWLEEGMAEDLSFNQVTAKGRIRLGSLAGPASQGLEALLGPRPFDLETLVGMDWETFIQPEDRALRYAACAMFLRFFSDGGYQDLRQGFRRYLAAVSEAELAASISLWETLGASPEEVEEELFRFVQAQARAHGVR